MENVCLKNFSYKDRDWLYQRYVVEEYSSLEIAKECGVCFQTICKWLNVLDIPARDVLNRMTKRTKKRLSVSHSGKILTEEHRKNISDSLFGRIHSEKAKRKISEANGGAGNGQWKGGLIKKICITCGIVFLFHKCRIGRKFCSQACYNRSGENNPRWNGGSSFEPYPIIFDNELKEWIRNRDGRDCQLCGKSEIENGKRLAVHHIDGNKANCDIDNLIALCVSCNSRADTIVKEFLCKIIVLNWRYEYDKKTWW